MSVARALKQALDDRYGDVCDTTVVDCLRGLRLPIPLGQLFRLAFKWGLKGLGGLPVHVLLRISERDTLGLSELMLKLLRPQVEDMLRRERPDVVVSTFPVASFAITGLLERRESLARPPVVSVVTDAGQVHQTWFDGSPSALVVSTAETVAQAREAGIPPDRIFQLGIPIHPAFARSGTPAEARCRVGLQEYKPTVLFTAGELGVSRTLLTVARRLGGLTLGAQYIFVAGENRRLFSKLEALPFRDTRLVMGKTDRMPELMAAADLVVGKAGWVTISESVAAQRPIVITDQLTSIERENARCVRTYGVGEVVVGAEEAVRTIVRYIKGADSGDWDEKMRSHTLPRESAVSVADLVVQISTSRAYPQRPASDC